MATRKKKTSSPQPGEETITVFVPTGRMRRDQLKQTAILGADIPKAAYNVKADITGASDPKTNTSGTIGRDYTIVVSWTPRGRTPPAEEPVGTVDEVLQTLQPLDPKTLTEHTEA